MHQSILTLESHNITGKTGTYRTTFKTDHGRELYLSVEIKGPFCTITDCFYLDRNQVKAGAARYSAKPKKLCTFTFPTDELLKVIEAELDKHFFGVNFVQSNKAELSLEEYLRHKTDDAKRKYRFLIMVGDGDCHNGLPGRLRTRLKTKLHRSVYLELVYYKDGRGVVKECFYYDREYRRENAKITPPQLISCFFPYTKEGILALINHEICCDFTHIIVTNGIDLDSDTTPLCGAV